MGGARGARFDRFGGNQVGQGGGNIDQINQIIKLSIYQIKKILQRSYQQPHRGGATGRILSKLQNPCRWTLRSDMPWWGSFFLRPLTYLSTLYVSTIVLLVLAPMYVKPTCREPTETTRHCRGLKWATCYVGLAT